MITFKTILLGTVLLCISFTIYILIFYGLYTHFNIDLDNPAVLVCSLIFNIINGYIIGKVTAKYNNRLRGIE